MNWNLKKSSNNKIDYIDNESISNFQIKKGVNYLIGNNNSGKTKLLNSIKSKDIEIETGNNKKPNMIYLTSDSRKIEDENTKKKQLMEGSLIDYIEKFEEEPIDITDKILNNFENSTQLKKFLGNKKINSKKVVTSTIATEIDGIVSDDSGSGENRLFYLVYLLSTFKDKMDKLFDEIINSNILIKDIVMSNSEIDLSWEDADELLNKYIRVINNEGKFKPVPLSEREKLDEYEIEIIQMIIDDISKNGNKIEKYWLFKILEEKIHINTEVSIEFYIISNDLEYGNFLNLFASSEFRKEINSYPENYKNEIVNHYIKNINDVKVEGPSWDFIVMIDEPENYIHVSKYLLVKEILMMILDFGNEYGINTRILINTHDDRIIKLIPEYIWNTNIAWKEKNKIYYKNLFENSHEKFISDLQKNVSEYFEKPTIKNLNDKNQISILNRYKSIDKEFMEWFLCHKENFKIFFNRNIMVTEGHHDKISLKSIVKKDDIETQIIETDGTQEGLLIWSLIILNNINLFKKVSFLIDLDLKHSKEDGNYMYLKNTYLMRMFLFDKFSNFNNVNLFFSKYNDITQWVNFIELRKKFLNKINEINTMLNEDLISDEIYQEKRDSNMINFIQNYNGFGNFKHKYGPYELHKEIEKIVNDSRDYTFDLFSKKLIVKDVDDFFDLVKNRISKMNFKNDSNSFMIENGKYYSTNYEKDKKIEIETNYNFPADFWKIDSNDNETYIVDIENKNILYIKAGVYDEIDIEEQNYPKLIEFNEIKFDKKYFNIFNPNLIRFEMGGDFAYLIYEEIYGGKLMYEDEISDMKMHWDKYTSNKIYAELFGTSFTIGKYILDNPTETKWYKEFYKDKILYINIETVRSFRDKDFNKYDYSIGPFNYEDAKEMYDKILENIWVEF